jgi:hypothetical protein
VHNENVNEDGFDRWGMLVSDAQRGDEVAYEHFLLNCRPGCSAIIVTVSRRLRSTTR